MFLSHLVLEADARPDNWIVRAPLVWCDALYGRLAVPEGFYTDLASIPRALRNLPAFDPNGKSRRPAVVHDWLYQCQSHPKSFADEFLRAALIAEGVSPDAAEAFYEAVRLFGQNSWDIDGGRTMAAAFVDAAAYQAYLTLQP